MFHKYLLRLLLRLIIAGGIIYLYFSHRELLAGVFSFQPLAPLGWLHLLWAALILNMLAHLWPQSPLSLAGRKQFAPHYQPSATLPPPEALAAYIQESNKGARRVMLLWLIGNLPFALLYWGHIIGRAEIVLLWAAYFVGDLVCMIVFCPFQSWLMKNPCCLNCRIFDWGHFMMYTPFALVNTFFSWSLFAMACLLLLHWELAWARYPERFWLGTNASLRCANCQEQLCRLKKAGKTGYL